MAVIDEYQAVCDKKALQVEETTGLYCDLTWDRVMCWDRTPAGITAKQPCPDYIIELSANGYATRECLPNGTWKTNFDWTNSTTEGWTNYSGCIGGKPAPKDDDDMSTHLPRIQLMSEIGYGASLVCLIVAVVIMIVSKRLHCKSNSLHINLFIAFILRASISFIKNIVLVRGLGFEKDIIHRPGGTILFNEDICHWECKLFVSLFNYTVTASCMWIFMEGLYLHMLVYKTLFTERHGVRLYVMLGWISPIVIVVPWVIVRMHFADHLCWNDLSPIMWMIKGPIILTVLINFIFFINIVRVLCIRVKSHRTTKTTSQHLRKIAKFALVLIPLFGVLYVCTAVYPQGLSIKADIIYMYCEMFYNSFLGCILALLFCFLNEEVHNEIKRCWHRRRFDGNSSNTRSVYLSSIRKSSNISRGTLSRDTQITGENSDNYDKGTKSTREKRCGEYTVINGKSVSPGHTDSVKKKVVFKSHIPPQRTS